MGKLDQLDASMRIVVLHGRESFLVREGTTRLTGLLREQFGGVDQFDFEGDTAELADVLDELRSYALFQGHKLVVVDVADQFVAGDTRRRALEAYAAQPSEGAT